MADSTEAPKDIESSTTLNSNTVTEKIKFPHDNEIDRALPELLSDNAKMSVHIWNKFCDDIDKCVKPIKKVKMLSGIIWFFIIAAIILNAAGWQFLAEPGDSDGNPFAAYYGIMMSVLVILLILVCNLKGYINKKVAAKISKICASASNHDRDLSMSLQGSCPNSWYIEVKLRNALDLTDSNIATSAPVAVAVAEPVAAAASPGLPPKKYIKDPDTGGMTLNPAYKAWKNSQ